MNSEKAVVITGASGFIGSNVAKLFVDSGFTVINIDKKKRELEGVTQYPFEIDNKQVKGVIELIKPARSYAYLYRQCNANNQFTKHLCRSKST